MTTRFERIDTYIESLLDSRFSCSCGRDHVIPTRKVVIAEKAVERLPNELKEILPGKRVVIVADKITDRVAGSAVAKKLSENGFKVEKILLPEDAQGEVVPDNKNVAYVEQNLPPEADFLLAVGSGTINDVVKLASTRSAKPYAVFATAPSMNGYPSPISAIIDADGFKSSVPANPPLAIIADVDIISQAPVEMIRAGVGDMISKAVACADWELQSMVKGEYYCSRPEQMISKVEKECFEIAEAIAKREKEAVAILMQCLIISGLAMTIAGSSSPASGAEHQIAHFWEMNLGDKHRFHGNLVGVATLIASTLYEEVALLNPKEFNPYELLQHYPSWQEVQQQIRNKHSHWQSHVITQVQQKYLPKEEKLKELTRILRNWDSIWDNLKKILQPSLKIKEILLGVGAPVTARELGISEEDMRHAFLKAKDIRSRYTILDLASDLGVLEELIDKVLKQSGVLN